jgi:hypothetical protein
MMENASRGSGWETAGQRGAFDGGARRGDSDEKSHAREGEIEREIRGATLLASRRSSGGGWRRDWVGEAAGLKARPYSSGCGCAS